MTYFAPPRIVLAHLEALLAHSAVFWRTYLSFGALGHTKCTTTVPSAPFHHRLPLSCSRDHNFYIQTPIFDLLDVLDSSLHYLSNELSLSYLGHIIQVSYIHNILTTPEILSEPDFTPVPITFTSDLQFPNRQMLWICLFIVEKLTSHMPIFSKFIKGAPMYTTIIGAYSFLAFYQMFFDTTL